MRNAKNNSLLKGEHKIESETERKNQRVTLRRSSNHRNCSDAQYFLGSDGAWQHCYVKKAVHNRRIQFLTEKSRKFRFETPLFDLDYLLFDTTDIIQEITDHETVRQALRSIKENERRIVLERIIEEKSFGQLSDELGMSYKTVASLYYRAIKKLRRFMEEGESK